jgi:PAS domain S-box-containing protein
MRYGLASASVALAALVAGAIPALRPTASALFAAATLTAAALAGFGPSLLAAVLSVLCLEVLVPGPGGSILGAGDFTRTVPLVALAALAAWLGVRRESEADGDPGREWFEAFMRNSPTYAYMKDEQGRYLFVNRRVQETFGLPAEAWLGRTDLELFPPEAAAQYRGHDQRVLASGAAMEFSEQAVGLQGARNFLTFKFPLVGRRRRPILAGVSIDVTDQMRAQEAMRQSESAAKEADRRKDEFLALLGHELRNPLGPIRHALEILHMMAPADARFEHARGVIDRQVMRIGRLLDDLLDVSRIAIGKVRLRQGVHDLGRLVHATTADHRAMFETAGVRLNVEVPSEPLQVRGDATRFSQVVGNLLHNALKFTDAGGMVTVRLAKSPDREEASIEVEDTGIGMDADLLSTAFEPFRQCEASVHRAGGGLGVGLALVKGLVELHGGAVACSSEGPGQGSRFTVRLPLDREAPSAPAAGESKDSTGLSIRVLVIEDYADAAESLAMLLEMLGHKVEIAHSGQAGIEKALRFSPELILCDVGLPDMDGYDVARRLRREPLLARAFLVALSGYGNESDKLRAQEAGFDRHVCKPIDLDAIRKLIAEIGS